MSAVRAGKLEGTGRGGVVTEPKRVEDRVVASEDYPALVEELVRAKGAKPIESAEDLERYTANLFESDKELEEFLAFVRETRNADLV
jgi:hypothetical protein